MEPEPEHVKKIKEAGKPFLEEAELVAGEIKVSAPQHWFELGFYSTDLNPNLQKQIANEL